MQPDPALDPAAPAGTMAPAPADVAAEPAAGAANQDVAAAPAPAEEQNADAGSADAQQFVEQAAISNQFEIESSQLALDAAENQEIRDFAQRMVDDHSNAGEQLKSTVESAGLELTVPEELDQEHADKLAQLQSATGADFDQQYAQMQVEAHDKAVELFSSYAERGDEEALKEFAADTLPTLQEHKEQIESIDMAAGVATAQTTEGQAPAEDVAAADASQPADATAPAQDMAAADTATNADGETFIGFNADQIRASTMMGQEVYGADEESIGEISDLVLQEDGETRAAIIDVGGFLGVGEKSVAIPFEQIEVQQQEGADPRLVVAMSREELEQAPAFESRTMEDVAATEPDAAADVTTEPEQDVAADPAAQPETEQEVAAEATEPLPEGVIAEDVTAEGEGAGFELATQDLSAEDLIGTAVVGTNEENIGEVGDVIFAQSGEIEAVVIDVGGFLGIGEKPVAVQFDALNVQKDTNGGVQLMINASQEQLEGAPSYEAEQAAVQ
jgi:predicted outer membrane protein/sporulation protein YlmC with PRC-barrel domain